MIPECRGLPRGSSGWRSQKCHPNLIPGRPPNLAAIPFESYSDGTMEQKRRTTHRFSFYAPAELVSASATELTAVTSLSLYGCYLEPTGHHPPGTPVTVKIFAVVNRLKRPPRSCTYCPQIKAWASDLARSNRHFCTCWGNGWDRHCRHKLLRL